MTTVANKQPLINPEKQRIALIGETPGEEEVRQKEPFVGIAGSYLAKQFSTAGGSFAACFKGYICQISPPNNRISNFKWDGVEIQEGLAALKIDLDKFKPNICVLLGNVPLKAVCDYIRLHPLIPKLFKYKIGSWRGSLMMAGASSPLGIKKCIPTYNPAYLLRDFKVAPLFQFDLRRAIQESTTPELILPQRLLKTNLSYQDIIETLHTIRIEKLTVAIDIEGGINSMSCISFATSSNLAFIVPFTHKDGSSVWTEQQECGILKALALTLEDVNVPKILQNALYDTFVLQYSYRIRVRNILDDIMIKHWALNSEFKKSLALQASIYTREPYWKHERLQEVDPQEKLSTEENKEEGDESE